ncbi:FdtA/QdtA family cupin domain-containing protein [Ruegeria sp. SCPT10]|uniref:sugar 3,4-ketoisomerase n=1 Tax=Ruegeria sp. SCP10 TaxID=3141377 RepID=UPI0033359561
MAWSENDYTELYGLVELPVRGDCRGNLVVIEQLKELPFELKRMFAIYGTVGNEPRGSHANRRSRFGFLCLNGSCSVKLIAPEGEFANVQLDSPSKLLWIEKMVWKEMCDFSNDCVLVVVSDSYYDPEEYIYSFEDYRTMKISS